MHNKATRCMPFRVRSSYNITSAVCSNMEEGEEKMYLASALSKSSLAILEKSEPF